jgi:hydrogenase nickel incorporation protein HypA/HybF
MHELGITSRIIQTVTQEMQRHGLSRVNSVRIRLGELSGIDPSALLFSWEASTRGTAFEPVRLEIQPVPASGRCRHCQREFNVVDLMFRCPDCQSGKIDLVRGQEIEIASLDVEQGNSE